MNDDELDRLAAKRQIADAVLRLQDRGIERGRATSLLKVALDALEEHGSEDNHRD